MQQRARSMAAACLLMAVLLVSQSAVGAVRTRPIAFAEVLSMTMHEVSSGLMCIDTPSLAAAARSLVHHGDTNRRHVSCLLQARARRAPNYIGPEDAGPTAHRKLLQVVLVAHSVQQPVESSARARLPVADIITQPLVPAADCFQRAVSFIIACSAAILCQSILLSARLPCASAHAAAQGRLRADPAGRHH